MEERENSATATSRMTLSWQALYDMRNEFKKLNVVILLSIFLGKEQSTVYKYIYNVKILNYLNNKFKYFSSFYYDKCVLNTIF